jgi:hypothetical protein
VKISSNVPFLDAGDRLDSAVGCGFDDHARISKELEGGHAAVGVLTASDEAAAVSDYLAKLGGASETHEAPAEALDHAASQPTS